MSSAAVVTALLKRQQSDEAAASPARGHVFRDDNGEIVRLTLTEEARLLVTALQNDEISEEELLLMVNTAPEKYDPDHPDRFAADVRARKIFRSVGG